MAIVYTNDSNNLIQPSQTTEQSEEPLLELFAHLIDPFAKDRVEELETVQK